MDALDVGILREMWRDRVLWWGGQDPRLSSAEIARRLRVERSTIWSRLRAWERAGFLTGYEVVPNTTLFGAGFGGGSIRVEDPGAKPQVLQDLGLVEGVIGAIDHVGAWVAVAYARESLGALERSRSLVARLSGVDEALPCTPYRPPSCDVDPSPLDWRILRSLRTSHGRPFSDAAGDSGISTKTFTRHLESLVRGNAVWSLPLFDFSRWRGGTFARLIVVLGPGADPHHVAADAWAKLPGLVTLMNPSEVAEGRPPIAALDLGALFDAAAQVEDAQRDLLAIAGVAAVEVLFPRGLHVYPHWFDERIAKAIGAKREGPDR